MDLDARPAWMHRPIKRREIKSRLDRRRCRRVSRLRWMSATSLLLLASLASCDLGELGTAARAVACRLTQAPTALARSEAPPTASIPMFGGPRYDVFVFLRSFPTGLPRSQEISLADAILDESRRTHTDYRLVLAIIETESTFSNWAVSPKGAFGLMQVKPSTGRWVARRFRLPWAGNPSLFNPATNVRIGITYLTQLRAQYGSLERALVAYNRGPAGRDGVLPVDPSSDPYVSKVLSNYRRLREEGVSLHGATARMDLRGDLSPRT
jgi:soluble lytic murein transglycosylase-like protein